MLVYKLKTYAFGFYMLCYSENLERNATLSGMVIAMQVSLTLAFICNKIPPLVIKCPSAFQAQLFSYGYCILS